MQARALLIINSFFTLDYTNFGKCTCDLFQGRLVGAAKAISKTEFDGTLKSVNILILVQVKRDGKIEEGFD